FFFEAEDGIRYFHVTGVQTCALPIYQLSAILLYSFLEVNFTKLKDNNILKKYLMKKKSIIDIARELNISPTTVSFILNDKAEEKRISKKLTKTVKDYVEKVGYKPSSIARSLRTGKTNTIGLMVENIANPFFGTVARKIEEAAYNHGYRILYCSTDNNLEKTKDLLHV